MIFVSFVGSANLLPVEYHTDEYDNTKTDGRSHHACPLIYTLVMLIAIISCIMGILIQINPCNPM